MQLTQFLHIFQFFSLYLATIFTTALDIDLVSQSVYNKIVYEGFFLKYKSKAEIKKNNLWKLPRIFINTDFKWSDYIP